MRNDRHVLLKNLIRDDFDLFCEKVLERLPVNSLDLQKIQKMHTSRNPKVRSGAILLLIEYFEDDLENAEIIAFAENECLMARLAAQNLIFRRYDNGTLDIKELRPIALVRWTGDENPVINNHIFGALKSVLIDKIIEGDLDGFLENKTSAQYKAAMILKSRMPGYRVKEVLDAFQQ